MEATLIRLACAQRSNALSTSFSAAETLSGSVLVLMASQRARIACSRANNSEPWLSAFVNSVIRAARSFQRVVNGVKTSLSPTRSVTATAARMARSCWRLSIFIGAPWSPVEVEGELQGRLAANLIHFEVGHLLGRAQLVQHFQKRLIIPGHTGAGDREEVANFQRLGRHAPTFGKGLGDFAEDRQDAMRFVEPWTKSFNLLLPILQVLHLGLDLGPLRLKAGQFPLLEKEGPGQDQRGSTGRRAGPD